MLINCLKHQAHYIPYRNRLKNLVITVMVISHCIFGLLLMEFQKDSQIIQFPIHYFLEQRLHSDTLIYFLPSGYVCYLFRC